MASHPQIPDPGDFVALAENLPQLAWIADTEGWIFWYNRRWYEYTGTTPADMAGWGWQSVHDPKVLPNVMQGWKASLATGEPFDMVFPLKGADGKFLPFLTRVQPIRDPTGRLIRCFGTNTDISEQMAGTVQAPVGAQLLIQWSEQGGPLVQAPSRRGFGSRLIEHGLAAELRGTVKLIFEPTGVVCKIAAPLPAAPSQAD